MLFIKAFTSYFHIYRPPTPPTVPSPHRPSSSSYCPIGAIHRHRRKNRRRAVSYVSTGLARLPRDANARTSTAEERLYKRHPGMLLVTPSARRDSGGRMGHRRGHHLYALRRCATSPSRRGVPSLKKPPPIGAIHRHRRKTAEERFHTLARGWLAYPVVVEKKTDGWDSNHRSLYRYVLLCDYLLTTRRSLIRAFLPVRLRR